MDLINLFSFQVKFRGNIKKPGFAKFKSKSVSHSRFSKSLKLGTVFQVEIKSRIMLRKHSVKLKPRV